MAYVTDIELTKACALAMGHKTQPNAATPDGVVYDPLHDDAQAMALVKRFRFNLFPYAEKWGVSCVGDPITREILNPDLNRAIVECVAKMGQQ